MNILIITLGTSDVQVNANVKNGFSIEQESYENRNIIKLKKYGIPEVNLKANRGYKDSYLLNSPRMDGEIIASHFNEFREILFFPLITPVVDRLLKTKQKIGEIWLVYTNQVNAESYFKNNDTLYFSEILKQKLGSELKDTRFVDYRVEDEVKNIDKLYKEFYQKALHLSERRSEIEKIFLLPQGGIDQINQALTLQLIQLFKDKVVLFQNAEKNEPVELMFPHLFLNDLTKHTVIKHTRDFDFGKVNELILDNEELARLAKYADSRLNLLHDKLADDDAGGYELKWSQLNEIERKKVKLQDLTYSFKILCVQHNYNEALTKLFAITDNIFQQPVSEYAGEMVESFYDRTKEVSGAINKDWENFIEEKLGTGYVKKLEKKRKRLNNPNFLALSFLYRLLITEGKISTKITVDEVKKLTTVVNDLRDIRNSIVHKLGTATETDVNDTLRKNSLNMEEFFDLLDKVVGTKGMGVYKEIQEKILQNYGEIL